MIIEEVVLTPYYDVNSDRFASTLNLPHAPASDIYLPQGKPVLRPPSYADPLNVSEFLDGFYSDHRLFFTTEPRIERSVLMRYARSTVLYPNMPWMTSLHISGCICYFCEAPFSSLEKLAGHVAFQHAVSTFPQCPFCEHDFGGFFNFYAHRKGDACTNIVYPSFDAAARQRAIEDIGRRTDRIRADLAKADLANQAADHLTAAMETATKGAKKLNAELVKVKKPRHREDRADIMADVVEYLPEDYD